MPGPLARYHSDVAEHGYCPDDAQLAVAHLLEDRHRAIVRAQHRVRRWWRFGRSRRVPIRGLYLHGGVGRGKTYLMDLFFDALPIRHKRRTHFHHLMRDVQDALAQSDRARDPLDKLAAHFSKNVRVLCVDEFVVNDIGDAMLLGGWLRGLFQRGVTLVATSNLAPWELYAEGLQRVRFLPAIELIEAHCEVYHVTGGDDYRLRALRQASVYFVPTDAAALRAMEKLFVQLSEGREFVTRALAVNHREILVIRRSDTVCWFDFSELCGGLRNTADYMEIAAMFPTVLLSSVPIMDASRDDEARRFINLIDEFYDRRVRLIVSAQAPAGHLYRAGRWSGEFQRTASRLREMRSHAYLSSARVLSSGRRR